MGLVATGGGVGGRASRGRLRRRLARAVFGAVHPVVQEGVYLPRSGGDAVQPPVEALGVQHFAPCAVQGRLAREEGGVAEDQGEATQDGVGDLLILS